MAPHSGRLHEFDNLRAAMMLLGIVLHVLCAYSSLPDIWWYTDRQTHPAVDPILVVIHIFRMPVFFAMAGFFAALLYAKRGAGGYLRNRFSRIGLPLAVGLAAFYPILAALGRYGRTWDKPGAAQGAVDYLLNGGWVPSLNPTHLWFLEYLLVLCVCALVVCKLPRPGILLESRVRFAFWPAATFATLCTMEFGLLDTPHAFVPELRILLAYAVFFWFGWMLHGQPEEMRTFESGWRWTLALGVCLALAHGYFVLRQIEARGVRENIGFYGAAATAAFSVWLLTFGLLGMFRRYMSRENAKIRYLADSSYWLYILHAPVVLFFHVLLAPTSIGVIAKAAIVLTASLTILLLTYDVFVRATWIGLLLNGRRYPRFRTSASLPESASQDQSGRTRAAATSQR